MIMRHLRCASSGRWTRAVGFALLTVGGSAVAVAQERATGSDPPSVQITIDNFTFTPAELTITPGTTVTWVNHDDIPHTVVETHRSFKSKTLDTDESFSMTFTAPGSFAYFCSLHPHMTGKVIVTSGS